MVTEIATKTTLLPKILQTGAIERSGSAPKKKAARGLVSQSVLGIRFRHSTMVHGPLRALLLMSLVVCGFSRRNAGPAKMNGLVYVQFPSDDSATDDMLEEL